jgi:hypothetical protein
MDRTTLRPRKFLELPLLSAPNHIFYLNNKGIWISGQPEQARSLEQLDKFLKPNISTRPPKYTVPIQQTMMIISQDAKNNLMPIAFSIEK